jgi:hypothetical protein
MKFMRKLLLATAASLSTLLAAGTANAQSLKPIAPGTIQVHLNGYLQFSFGDTSGNGESGGSYAKTSTVAPWKNNSIGTTGDIRLFPGFDGMTVNNVAYGAQVELRTATTNANGAGVNGNGTSTNGVGSLYVRRAYGYLGTVQAGYVRFGQGDGAFELLQHGVIETFGDGSQWTGDGTVVTMLSQSAPTQFIYADQGALYTTNKIVYITPAFVDPIGGKLSAAISYEPNSNGIKEGDAATSSSFANENDSISGSSANRRRNTVDAMVDYQIKEFGFATKISGGFLGSSPLGNTTGAQIYSSMSVWQFGAQTTYTGLFTGTDTFTLGAKAEGGSLTDKYGFKKVGARDALGYIVGGAYTVGPYVLGASFWDQQEANNATVTGHNNPGVGHTLSEYGVSVGGNYIVAKPLSLFVQYLYGNVHGAAATSTVATGPGLFPRGNSHVQAIAAGATFKW